MWSRAFGVRCHASAQSIYALKGYRTSSNTNARVNRSSSSATATEGSSSRKRSSSSEDRSSSSSSNSRISSGSGRGRSNSTNSTGSRKQPGTPHGSSSSSNGRVDRRSVPPPPRARDILLKPRRAAALETASVERGNTSRSSVAVLPALGSNGSDDPTYVPRWGSKLFVYLIQTFGMKQRRPSYQYLDDAGRGVRKPVKTLKTLIASKS